MKNFFLTRWNIIFPLLCNPHYMLILLVSGGLLLCSVYVSLRVSKWNDMFNTSYAVGDLLFEIIPRLDLSFLFVGAEFILIPLAILYAIFWVPERIPLAFFAFTVFVLIRACTISLTHIGVPIDYVQPSAGGGSFFFQNDLFFSGHTGGPYLVALLLWEKKVLRYILLFVSVLMAFTVLAMRLHYSIDVIGAYFITYGVFHLAHYMYSFGNSDKDFFKSWFLRFDKKKI